MIALIDRLEQDRILEKAEFVALLEGMTDELREQLATRARGVSQAYYGKGIYLRGLIELTSYCKNDCYYCGIRHGNQSAERYRLTPEQVFSCCEIGYDLGFRTFVLQGGEDPYFTDERLVEIVTGIRQTYPDCAITLSLGERDASSYEALRKAGADRYLLRHETATAEHYASLHPANLTLKQRQDCLFALKRLGFQVGSGFMVGSPGQTAEHLAEDLHFLRELSPNMVGIGPFLPHHATPFADQSKGSLTRTLALVSILRLMFPNILLPATTALGTIHPTGREMGILAGANVVMPNLSPITVRKKYLLYDNKIATGEEAAESRDALAARLASIGYEIVSARGDCLPQASFSGAPPQTPQAF